MEIRPGGLKDSPCFIFDRTCDSMVLQLHFDASGFQIALTSCECEDSLSKRGTRRVESGRGGQRLRFPPPLIKPDARNYRILCFIKHKMRYVKIAFMLCRTRNVLYCKPFLLLDIT